MTDEQINEAPATEEVIETQPEVSEPEIAAETELPAPEADVSEETNLAAEAAQSLTNPEIETTTQDPQAEIQQEPTIDIEEIQRQNKELNKWATQTSQERAELRKQLDQYNGAFNGRSYEDVQRQLQEYEQWQHSVNDLKPWQQGHPEHSQYLRLVDDARGVGERIQAFQNNPNLDQETKAQLIQAEQARITPDQQEWLRGAETYRREFMSDPGAKTMQIAEQIATQVFEQKMHAYQAQQQADQNVNQWFSEHQESTDKFGGLIAEVMTAPESGRQFEVAQAMTQLLEENDKLKSQIQGNVGAQQQAAAQQQALKSNANKVSVDPQVSQEKSYDEIIGGATGHKAVALLREAMQNNQI